MLRCCAVVVENRHTKIQYKTNSTEEDIGGMNNKGLLVTTVTQNNNTNTTTNQNKNKEQEEATEK